MREKNSKIVEIILKILKNHNLLEDFHRQSYFIYTFYKNLYQPLTVLKQNQKVYLIHMSIEESTSIEVLINFKIIGDDIWELVAIKLKNGPNQKYNTASPQLQQKMEAFLAIWIETLETNK